MIYIKKLRIQNFKSIENEIIEFNKGLNVLVGPNNAGKTNIIEVLDLLFGDVYLPNYEPSTDDYFNGKEDKEIIIEAILTDDNNELQNIIPESEGEIQVRFRYSKENKGFFELNKNSKWEQKYNKPFGYYWDFDRKLFFLRVKSLRNIMEIAPIRWKSPLRYFKEMIIKRAEKNKLIDVLTKIEEAKNELMEINEVKNVIASILKISKDQTDIKDVSISPAPVKYSDILNEMKILVDDGYLSDVTKKGLGTQNSIFISLFRVMAEYISNKEEKYIIYGIDEPEIGLHPHGQRQLKNSLKRLSEYSQVIITTHSEHLIDITQIDNIIRIGKEGNKTRHYKIDLTPDEKKILEIHGRNLKELFFTKRVLLVEGDTEEGFFPEVSEKVQEKENNYSFDYNSVSVVNGMGDNFWLFIKLLRGFNIPFIVLLDEDKIENGRKDSFLEKLYENRVISSEEKLEFQKLDIKEFKNKLKTKNFFILKPFEKMISAHAKKETLKKILDSIQFVKKHWGYESEDMNKIEENDLDVEKLRELVFNLLKNNKRWRIGKKIGKELEYSEIPQEYIDLIKTVSKL